MITVYNHESFTKFLEVEMHVNKNNWMALIFTVLMVTTLIGQNLSVYQIFLPVDSEKLTLEAEEQRIVNINKNAESVSSLKIVTAPTIENLSTARKLIFVDFSGISHSFVLGKFDEQENSQYLWYGKLEKGLGSITLIYIDNRITGTIRINGTLYKITPVNENLNIISLIDQSSFTPEDPIDKKFKTENSPELNSTISQTETLSESTPIIRVLVAYTSVVAANHDEHGLIATAIAETNQSFANSGIDAQVELAHEYQVNYTETGRMETDLSRFRTNGDGYMDEVHQRRNQYYADVCMLITETGNWYGLASKIRADSFSAFAQSRADATAGNYTFGHEIGHLMAARHNIELDPTPTPYEEGHGYLYKIGTTNGQWRTIMGILDVKFCPSCPRIQYWSNPSKYYGDNAMGNKIYANVARVWNIEASRLANFRSDPPVDLSLLISGPTWLDIYEYGTFTANPAGGSGTYVDYKWWSRNDEGIITPLSLTGGVEPDAPLPGLWNQVSSWDGLSTVTPGYNWDFSLKCEVTDSEGQTATDIHSVIVGSPLLAASRQNGEMAISAVPAEFSLQGNYPNPFNPVTTIRFGLPEAANVKLVIYSVTGAKVATLVDGYLSEGYHEAQWNGVNQAGARVASGIYIYELISGEKRFIKKMLLAKVGLWKTAAECERYFT